MKATIFTDSCLHTEIQISDLINQTFAKVYSFQHKSKRFVIYFCYYKDP